jgi:hypothetical protein
MGIEVFWIDDVTALVTGNRVGANISFRFKKEVRFCKI